MDNAERWGTADLRRKMDEADRGGKLKTNKTDFRAE